jgi:hypothetical protein
MSTPTRDARPGAAYDARTSAAEAPASPAPGGHCLNCEAALAGPYCAQCGQRARPPRPTLREVLGEAWDEFVNVDGRFLASLRVLLTSPGGLTVEALAGRRARYLGPLRLYLLCSLAYFVAAAALPDRVHERRLRARAAAVAVTGSPLPKSCRPPAAGEPAFIRVMRRLDCKTDRDPVRFETARRANVPRLMFVLVPLFAAIVALTARGRTFPEHLYFALHFHAFAFLAMTVAGAATLLPAEPVRTAARSAMVVAVGVYGCLALRRVYGGGWGRVAGRAVVVALLYGLAFLGGMAGVLLVTAARM